MRKYLIGIMIGICLSFAVGAHAEVASMIGKVVQGEYDFTIGNDLLESKAIIVDGMAYVPARLAGETSGHIVRFDETTGVKWVKKIMIPKATVLKSIEGINSSIATTQRMITAKETAISALKNGPQNDIVIADIKNSENSIERWNNDISELKEQIKKLNQTLEDIDAQQAELAN